MEVETVLFGRMWIPDDKDSILKELQGCRNRHLEHPSRYLQTRIDYLEYALDSFRRTENV